jgi:adhesin transport system membrane fusion protein
MVTDQSTHRVKGSELSFVTDANAAVLEHAPRGGSLLIWAVAVFVIIFLVWAYYAALDVVVKGQGKVIPVSQIQVVQNLEGGIVQEINVKEGQVVEAGEILLQIDDTLFQSSFKEDRIKRLALQLKGIRLEAEANGKTEFPTVPENIQLGIEDLVTQERQLFNQRQSELEAKRQILIEQKQQKEHQLEELKSKQINLKKGHRLAARELKLTRPLKEQGAVSEVELLRLERQVNELKGELDQVAISIPRARSERDEVESKLDELHFRFIQEAQGEFNDLSAELSTLSEASVALQDRVARTAVRAPLKGTVKTLLINTVGGVVQPGMDLIEIVPIEEGLLVEARVMPKDIAFIRPGLKATVKLTAYDFAIYGGLEAKVEHISADTYMDERDDTPYYLVRVRTSDNFLVRNGETLPIIPGMTTEVDILAGKKTVLDYLLKPILKARDNALQER